MSKSMCLRPASLAPLAVILKQRAVEFQPAVEVYHLECPMGGDSGCRQSAEFCSNNTVHLDHSCLILTSAPCPAIWNLQAWPDAVLCAACEVRGVEPARVRQGGIIGCLALLSHPARPALGRQFSPLLGEFSAKHAFIASAYL
jgi:hypothetical protein